jgi:CP family cyanate transporter-like MFS transporter
MTTAAAGVPTARELPHRTLLVAAMLLTGFSMRTAATSVGAVLDSLQHGLHVASGVAGLITTLPVLCFAVLGSLTPRVARRVGPHRLLTAALVVTTVGLALRPLTSNVTVFVLLSVLGLSGGAVSNVLMPSLVKRHFPDRVGAMTAVYTTALAVGSTAGAGVSVPIGDAVGGWRFGIGFWAIFTAVAVLPWLTALGNDRRSADAPAAPAVASMASLLHSRTAWALMVFFAAQSMQAYIAFGWFARFLSNHGIAHSTAGAMVALYAALSIPVSVVTPRVVPSRQRVVIAGFCACTATAYAGMAIAPVGGAWAWMVLAGVGAGTFPMALTLIGQRSRTASSTAALSAFVQAIGYTLAGLGPVLFGALFGATGSWGLPLTVLFVAVAITFVASFPATARVFVDDEMAASPA